jgi:hypothetical protein
MQSIALLIKQSFNVSRKHGEILALAQNDNDRAGWSDSSGSLAKNDKNATLSKCELFSIPASDA